MDLPVLKYCRTGHARCGLLYFSDSGCFFFANGPGDLTHRLNDVVDLLGRHGWIEREGHEPAVQLEGVRASVMCQARQLREIGMKRYRNEVDTCPDVSMAQKPYKL